MNHSEKILNQFKSAFPEEVVSFHKLKRGVSDKLIIRISTTNSSIIGVYNENIKENEAYIGFTNVFNRLKLNTSEILHVSSDRKIYFAKDLGKETLYDILSRYSVRSELIQIYKRVIEYLVKFQVLGADTINFKLCSETITFDHEQIKHDAEKFNKYFLIRYLQKEANILDDKVLNDIMDLTINVSGNYFMYRDFQPRNIIIRNNEPYFVDYQSGRLGSPQYDLISFLYSGSIDITDDERNVLKSYFYEEFTKYNKLDKEVFFNSLDYFALLRIIQVLGSYSYSYFEKKNLNVLSKIPVAINNLQTLNLNNNLDNLRKQITELYSTRTSEHQSDSI
ncbi:MAG: phosphotransferase [Candidatus Kapaibacterium sp.]